MKKLLSIILAVLMLVSIIPASVFADNATCVRPLVFEENIATNLKTLNLFKGVSDTDFALNRVPTRIEALVIMLRLMGKESEILSGTYAHPFKDVPDWANNYVGYAYQNKLTNGISKTEFGTDSATDAMFVTFILRAMGYSDANGKDFTWSNPYALATKLGVVNAAVTTGTGFLRADCASISYYALGAKIKGENKTLAEKLAEDKVFDKSAYDAIAAAMPDYPGMFKAYGLKFHTNPGNVNDQYDNMCYYIATGAFEWTYDGTGNLSINALACIKPEIAGYVMNQARQFCLRNGKYYIKLRQPAVSPFTPAEVSKQIIDAYTSAKKIDDYLRSVGAINNSSNETTKATAISNYLQTYGVKTPSEFLEGKLPSDYTNVGARIKYMSYDTAYGALVNKLATCGGKAAAYNLVMSIEGIKSLGLQVSGHMVSYLRPDGNEILCDWGNGYGLFTIDSAKASNAEYFEGSWLAMVRDYYFSGALNLKAIRSTNVIVPDSLKDMPKAELKRTSEDNTYYYYKVTMTDKSYIGASLRIIFGDFTYYFIFEPSTGAALKSGVEFRIPKVDIADYDMLECVFLAPTDWKQ